MAVISKSLTAAYLISLRNKLLFPVNAAGIKLCIGEMPTDAEIETLTQSSSRITDNVAVTINTTGLTSKLKDTAWPPTYASDTLPSNPKALSTKVGKIGWCVFYHTNPSVVVIGDVTLTNGTGLVSVDALDVVVGTPVTLTNIAIQVKRWNSEA